jgi:plastocyanin
MVRPLRTCAVVLLGIGGLALSSCSTGGSSPSSAPASSSSAHSDVIMIHNFMFTPMNDTVSPGTTITVTNNDSVTHTLSATGGQFNTGSIGAGQTKRFTAPAHAGSYHYICDIHQYMMGTITVK